MKNVKENLVEGSRHGKEKATWERFYGRWVVVVLSVDNLDYTRLYSHQLSRKAASEVD